MLYAEYTSIKRVGELEQRTVFDAGYMTCPQKANLKRENVDLCLLKAGMGMGMTVNGHKNSSGGDGNVLKLDRGASGIAL